MEPENQPQSNPPEQPGPVIQASPGAAPTPPVPAAEPQQAQAATLPLPDAWPGAFGAYKYSKQAVMVNLSSIALLWIVSIAITFVLELVLKTPGRILSYIIEPIFAGATTLMYITGVRNQKLSLGDAISKGLKMWLNLFILYILVSAAIIISLILLVIPFFFVWPRVALAYYYLVDKELGPVEAFKASWDGTKGNAGKLYGILGANIAMVLLMITIIGIPFSIYFLIMYSAVTAVLYEIVLKHPAQPAGAPSSVS